MKFQRLRNIVWVSLGVAVLLSTAVVTMAEPPSYEFRLRGGGFGSGQILTKRGSSPNTLRLVVSFKFGNSPAGEGLEPGQGSWLDRGMRPNEPVRIEGDLSEKLAAQVGLSLAHNRDAYWIFWIFNTNRGYFQITRPPTPFGNTRISEINRL